MGSDNSDEENRDRVLAPDDLDITKQPEVEEIDDGRYVVSPSGPAKKPDRDLLENPDWLDDPDDEETTPQPDQSSRSQSPPQGQPSNQQQSSQSDPSTSRQPQPNDGSTRQPGGRSGQNQDPPNTQSGGRTQQPPNAQSGGRNQQSAPTRSTPERSTPDQSPSDQSTPNRSQQADATTRSSSRSQQPPAADQSDENPPHPSSNELAAHDQPPVEPPAAELTNENVSKFLAESLAQGSGDYGFDATVNIEGQVNRGRMTSDDIGETLETLLRWYARQTTDEVEPETVLGIILAGSDLAVEYPVQSAYAVVKQHDLKPDDTISDLLDAVRKEGSFTVPPSKD